MTTTTEPEPPSRGRPRDSSIDRAVLAATTELVAEVGYGRLSIDMVARRAGVTRPTVYLRWRNKPELVHAALFQPSGDLPVTGRIADDLRAVADRAIDAWGRPGIRAALLGLLADAAQDPELHATVNRSIVTPIMTWLTAVLGASGAPDGVDPEQVYDLFMGPLVQHHVHRGGTDRGVRDLVIRQVVHAIDTWAESGS